MLNLVNKETGKKYSFFLMDAHHHLGEDEDGMEVKPIGPNNTYSFCRKVFTGDGNDVGLKEEIDKNKDAYKWIMPDDPVKIPGIVKKFEKDNINEETKKSYAIDKIVVFPMHDVFRDKGSIMYSASNDFVSQWTNIHPHSKKLIGFGRIDPKEGKEENYKEIDRMVEENNLYGIKMHPQSDNFDIGDQRVKEVLVKAASMNLPVIFHTSYGNEVEKLEEMVNDIIIKALKNDREEIVSNLKVIIGHCTYRSEKVYEALSHPSIYGELSVLKKSVDYLKKLQKNVNFQSFKKEILSELRDRYDEIGLKKLNSLYDYDIRFLQWHHKVMVGTDHPYMPVSRLINLLLGMFSSEADLKSNEIQNIMAGNLLRILTPKIYDTKNNVSELTDYKFLTYYPLVGSVMDETIKKNINIITFEKANKKYSYLSSKIKLENIKDDKKDVSKHRIYKLNGRNNSISDHVYSGKYPNNPIKRCSFPT